MYKKILVPVALDHGLSPKTLTIARTLGGVDGHIVALHVHEEPEHSVRAYVDETLMKKSFERANETLHEKIDGHDGVQAEIVQGHTYRSIIDYAQTHGIDCIVMGSHKPGIGDYLLGSTAARVVRHAPCAVHVYRSV
ncbi:MAG: universal stress protein [Pseudomonadota bacterium]